MEHMEKRLLLAYEGALATRGKHKGMLKAKCPKAGTDAALMWQALMVHANPYKASVFSAMFAAWTDAEFFEACRNFAAEKAAVLRHLDRERAALTRLGVW